jgi:hypothetical protein
MIEQVRQLFESQVYPSFAGKYNLNKKNNGEYASDVLEDHWNTFQEGFELAVKECMRMCDVAAAGYETHGNSKEANGCASAKEYIREHFGVEE